MQACKRERMNFFVMLPFLYTYLALLTRWAFFLAILVHRRTSLRLILWPWHFVLKSVFALVLMLPNYKVKFLEEFAITDFPLNSNFKMWNFSLWNLKLFRSNRARFHMRKALRLVLVHFTYWRCLELGALPPRMFPSADGLWPAL